MVVRDLRRHVPANECPDFLRSQCLPVSLLLDDLERIDHSLAFFPGTGSALASHAVYQRLLSMVPARASSVAMKSVPLARGCCGLNSPVFSRSYMGSSSLNPC